jgi:ABC-2 type transport system ATP-binding protein
MLHTLSVKDGHSRVSFDVAPGVISGLLGPNGAGKTALLRIMLGLLCPDRGEVRYDGRRVGEP